MSTNRYGLPHGPRLTYFRSVVASSARHGDAAPLNGEKRVPVEHHHTIKAGATRQLLFVYAGHERAPEGAKTGLEGRVDLATAAFVREGESSVHRTTLIRGRLGEWSPGSFAEVDAEVMSGV